MLNNLDSYLFFHKVNLKILVSNSTDKQGILRTLFNSIRFEEIQNLLKMK